MKKGLFTVGLMGLLGIFGAGCADPCGDIQACCDAVIADLGLEGEALEAAQATCDAYESADSDACQAAIDAFEPVEGADVPAECEF
jgi:hypothetical protein